MAFTYMNDSLKTSFQEYKFGFNLTEKNYVKIQETLTLKKVIYFWLNIMKRKNAFIRKSKNGWCLEKSLRNYLSKWCSN